MFASKELHHISSISSLTELFGFEKPGLLPRNPTAASDDFLFSSSTGVTTLYKDFFSLSSLVLYHQERLTMVSWSIYKQKRFYF